MHSVPNWRRSRQQPSILPAPACRGHPPSGSVPEARVLPPVVVCCMRALE
ncbi:hypothetical protein [Lysobacter gummosus]